MLAGEHVLPLTDTLQARARASARASAGARDVVIVSVVIVVIVGGVFVVVVVGGGGGGGGGWFVRSRGFRARQGIDFLRQNPQQHAHRRHLTTHPLQPIQRIAHGLRGQGVGRNVDGLG